MLFVWNLDLDKIEKYVTIFFKSLRIFNLHNHGIDRGKQIVSPEQEAFLLGL